MKSPSIEDGTILTHPKNGSQVHLGKLLGKGSFGQVREGVIINIGTLDPEVYTPYMGKRVAVKLAIKRARDLLIEYAQISKLSRRGVLKGVTVSLEEFSNAMDADAPWVVQELLGKSLGERLRENGKLTPRGVLHLGSCLLDTIEQVHKAGIVHQDIKPDNIMLLTKKTRLDRCGEIYYVDFGGACDRDTRTSKSNPCRMVGTPGYMSIRQQAQGGKPVFRDDLESIVYTCLRCMMETLPWSNKYFPDESRYSYYRRMVEQKKRFGVEALHMYFGSKVYVPFALMLLEGRMAEPKTPINYQLIREAFQVALREVV